MNSVRQEVISGPLSRKLRTNAVLWQAWNNVAPRVLSSKDREIKKAAQRFSHDPHGSIRRLQEQLRGGTFQFAPQRGVLRTRASGKLPRPIVAAPMLNRIVQRAILDICQTNKLQLRQHLGRLPQVIETPTSVGGVSGKGCGDAMRIITDAIARGSRWFVRSDLKNFFVQVPKHRVETFLNENVADEVFVELFMNGLRTELSNEDEVRALLHLFPLDDLGVPQGCALSALCGNIVLEEFDRVLNGRGITTVRYLDDFIILGPTKEAVDKAWRKAVVILAGLGMEAHDPDIGSGKASRGRIDQEGVDFLSFHIKGTTTCPSRAARASLLEKLRVTIREDKRAIRGQGLAERRAERRFAQSLVTLDRQIRGWGDAFKISTQRVIFNQIDEQINKLLEEYWRWFQRQAVGQPSLAFRRLTGVSVLADTP
jgi:RNA-directed DNA polymerase